MSINDSISYILSNNISLSRFGDGELNIIMGGGIHFQDFSYNLRTRLIEILSLEEKDNFKVGIPISINTTNGYNKQTIEFWDSNMSTGRFHWIRLCNKRKTYINSCFTWCFSNQENKLEAKEHFKNLLKLWQNKSILIIEGKNSKLGVYNSLFSNAKSIKRIICPSQNAFEHYNKILRTAITHYDNELVLISLGPTATILAYDLYKKGIRAIDIGHLNNEYNKYISYQNIKETNIINENDYLQQIIATIQ